MGLSFTGRARRGLYVAAFDGCFWYDCIMKDLQQLCIIGPTASGKSSLGLAYAHQHRGIILSLDSLALYQEIDIASAKPTLEERGMIPHFGIDVIAPDVPFDVTQFTALYHLARTASLATGSPLIIVGGTGFYLKMLLEGISPLPPLSPDAKQRVAESMNDLTSAYRYLRSIDPDYAQALESSDRYRIEKALDIFFGTGMPPTEYFRAYPPQPVIADPLPIYEITVERPVLRQRIVRRTDGMITAGLIDEVCGLERRYTRAPNAMKAIGIKEVLEYLDGYCAREEMREKIITNTARLAKRQVTFNRSQFHITRQGTLEELERELGIRSELDGKLSNSGGRASALHNGTEVPAPD